MHTYEDLQEKRISHLNEAITTGLSQLKSDKKVLASSAYPRLKQKIQATGKHKS